MQKENASFFLPAIGGIFLLLLIGAGILYFGQQKSQINNPSNLITNNSSQTTTAAIPPEISKNKMADEIFLTISEPVDKSTATSPNLIISGKTVANAEISINDKSASANSNGDFSVMVNLEEGDNYFFIIANDSNGLSAEKEIMVTYESQTS